MVYPAIPQGQSWEDWPSPKIVEGATSPAIPEIQEDLETRA